MHWKKKSLVLVFFGLSFIVLPKSNAQDAGLLAAPNGKQSSKGIIVIASKKGITKFTRRGFQLQPKLTVENAGLQEGVTIETGPNGSVVLLFSNGTVGTIGPSSKISVNEFSQINFDGAGRKMGDLRQEPSTSNTKLALDFGSLVVATKKLKRESRLTITTPSGTAGIRGTQFQVAQPQGGGFSLDVTESTVTFTPAGGGNPVLVNAGGGLDIPIGGLPTPRLIRPRTAKVITESNTVAIRLTAIVSLTVLSQEIERKNNQSGIRSPTNRNQFNEEDDEDTPAEEKIRKERTSFRQEETTAEKQDLKERTHTRPLAAILEQLGEIQMELDQLQLDETRERIAELEQSKISASGAELEEIEKELERLKKVEEELESILPAPPPPPTGGPTTSPPTINPGSPPGTNEFSYDASGDKLTIPSSASKYSTTQYLEDAAITEAKLIEMKVDDTIAMAIPILRDVILKDPTNVKNGYFNAALSDVTRIAGQILTDVTLSGSIPSERVWNADKLLSELGNNPYTYELTKLLAKKGAIGEKSAPNREHANIETLASDIIALVGGREKLNNISTLNDLIDGEISEAGTGINTQLLGARKFTVNEKDADLFNVKLKNINAALGSNVTIEKGDIDVSSYLAKAVNSGDRKIFAVGAAKDLTIKDSVTFKNDNKVEDHALAIGAADDVHFRSGSLNNYLDEAFMEKYLDETDPVYTSDQDIQPTTHPPDLDLTYEGSNLGLGSYDTLELVNVNVTTGGNLAVGTLKELHILSTDPGKPSRITVGLDSDSDNAYLYAQERIAINGLEFGGRVNEIYMESITIDLKNVAFPENSEVMLRSQYGRATFGASNRVLGAVNFIKNVSHKGGDNHSPITLGPEHFSGPDGHVNSSITVNDGVPAVRIRAFSSANK